MEQENNSSVGMKMFEVHSMMLRWCAKNIDHCFDPNGKKPDTLTRTQLDILNTIYTLEKTTLSQLEVLFKTSKSSLSITISRLVKDGYIQRQKEDADGRVTYLMVTPKAVNIMKHMLHEIMAGFTAFYNTLSKEQREVLETGVDCFHQILKVNTQEEK